jgi:hypothetical protein
MRPEGVEYKRQQFLQEEDIMKYLKAENSKKSWSN